MGFPKPPFTLSSDRTLILWAKEHGEFSFLGREARKGLLALDEGEPLDRQRGELRALWPLILTDALRGLKKRDPREVDPHKPPAVMESRFHEASLGVKELRDLLAAFSDFEGLIYGASPERYRDHIAHPFRVWLLGHALIGHQLGWDLAPSDMPRGMSIAPVEWECMWAIAGLCHDVGYPVKAVENVNELARKTLGDLGLTPASVLRFGFSPQMLPFHESMIRLLAGKVVRTPGRGGYVTHLQSKYYLKYLKSFDRLDHGIVSALLISRAMVYFLESDMTRDEYSPLDAEDARQFVIRREILRAIASHTCPDIYHLTFNTLSFMLYLIDEIQCWGRPTLQHMRDKTGAQPRAKARIKRFDKERIALEIRHLGEHFQPPRPAEKGTSRWVSDKLDRLHRMLRLAVDTPSLSDRLRLKFSLLDATGEGPTFLLEESKITKTPPCWFKRPNG